MIVLAGIDEAGLGPTLGPLTTAAAALFAPDAWEPETPWDALSGAFCREWRRGETRAGVADSKVLYRAGGLAALELTAGAFSLLASGRARPALECGEAAAAPPHPCYSGGLEPFPILNDEAVVEAAAEAMRRDMEKAGAGAAHFAAGALFEPAFNRSCESGLNKNQILLRETGRHLAALAGKFPDRRVRAVVDKQGGRNEYLPFLAGLFPGAWIDTLEEGAERSRYRLRRPGGAMEIAFQAKADRTSFATALASLLAKYARERAMRELNAWFGRLLPEVGPTAGYPQDARRWLGEVGGRREARLDLLIRRK